MTGSFQVFYPSGITYTVFGVWRPPMKLDDSFIVSVEVQEATRLHPDGEWISPGGVIVIDPRAVVRCDGMQIYSPRPFMAKMPREFRDWLRVNKDWPARLQRRRS